MTERRAQPIAFATSSGETPIYTTSTPGGIAARAEYWARALTAIPSVTGTTDEAAFADRLVELLQQVSAFTTGGAVIEVLPVPGGLFPRKVVFLLVRGSGPDTMILTGHYDTVEVESYGILRHLALDPDKLLPALIETLEAEPPSEVNARALADFKSGRFLPGRGLLDMKAGLAAALAAMEEFATTPKRAGNLLFVAVPDEEANSAGARTAAPSVAGFAARHSLKVHAAINMDAIADDGDGAAGRVAAMGTVGKLLPTALVVGRPAHASYAFRGLGAAALAGALAAEMEWLPALTERYAGEITAGPTLLGMKDTRQGYDVTMPERVWMYWNVALVERTPQQVLAEVMAAARRASDELLGRLEARRSSLQAEGRRFDVRVASYAELLQQARGGRPSIDAELLERANGLAAQGETLPEIGRALTEQLWEAGGLSGPAIIIGFGSTPYVPVLLRDIPRHTAFRRAILSAAETVGARHGSPVGTRPFFPAISDVSFFGDAETAGLAMISDNTPMWRAVFAGEQEAMIAGLPTVNIGPWGRDYHARIERLDADYAFTVLPELLLEVGTQLFENLRRS